MTKRQKIALLIALSFVLIVLVWKVRPGEIFAASEIPSTVAPTETPLPSPTPLPTVVPTFPVEFGEVFVDYEYDPIAEPLWLDVSQVEVVVVVPADSQATTWGTSATRAPLPTMVPGSITGKVFTLGLPWSDSVLVPGATTLYSRNTSSRCGLTSWEAAQMAKEVADEFGIPRRVFLSVIASESWFVQYAVNPGGTCGLMHNSAGAYCMGQIYRPKGSGYAQEIHPEVSVAELYDPKTCLRTSARILVGRGEALSCTPGLPQERCWDNKVLGYKNIKVGSDNYYGHFTTTYLAYLEAGKVLDQSSGVLISFD